MGKEDHVDVVMINNKAFYEALERQGVDFFTGVPDSLLKDFCAYITDNTPKERNIIAANEGGAIALASGYNLATGKIGLVYMQNSGLGNAVNPLTSLADKEVYSIPMLLLIGWRAEPGVKDEPQHVKQGRITPALLETLGIPYEVISESSEVQRSLEKAVATMKQQSTPYAFVVKKGTFEPYSLKNKVMTSFELSREEAIQDITAQLTSHDVIVSTTGMISRELFEYRERAKQSHQNDFLTVGSMGHSSQIALGIALAKPHKSIYCLDGDGAAIMHTGHLAIIGQQSPKNFKHIILNNGAHDSVGGQPTAGFEVDFPAIAIASGYKHAFKVETRAELEEKMKTLKSVEGPALLEIRVNKGHRADLGRPTTTPLENKKQFMEFLDT